MRTKVCIRLYKGCKGDLDAHLSYIKRLIYIVDIQR